MKKILFLIACLSASMLTFAADSDWHLYFYSEANSINGDAGCFQKTADDNVFVIEQCNIPAKGISFSVYKSDWSAQYGWKDAGVTATGVAVGLASSSSANGWLDLEAGTCRVTFNLSDLTIRFDVPTSSKKKVSILGDSYSTMQGSLTPSENAYWYTLGENPWHETDVTSVEKTWWYQFINGGDYELEVNNSYSGSTMVNTPLEDMDVSTTFISRARNLGNPDIIFVFGGTNDNWNTALKIGDYKYSDWTEEDKKQFRAGFAYLLHDIKTTYPDADVYFILNDILSTDINRSIITICDYYHVPCIVTKGVEKSEYHPNAAGMTTIANQVKTVVEKADDEGDTWFVSGAFNSWSATQTFTKSSSNSDLFTLANFKITADKLDAYNGFSFQIVSENWGKSYTYNATIASSGVYCLEDKTNTGAWGNIYCTAMEAGKNYILTWNKRTHVLTMEEGNDPAVSFTTYADGHALAMVSDYLRGGDISMLNYVEDMGAKFYDAAGNERDPLDIMEENGVNIVRLRLYNNPGNEVSYTVDENTYTYKLPAGYLDEDDVLKLARRAKAHNMKIELTFHYSDFWTNGEMQFKPKDWEGLTMEALKEKVHDYTYNFLQRMNAQGTTPDYVSLGNEIQSGLLFGHSAAKDAVNGYADNSNMANVAALLAQGSAAVRSACPQAKVVIHLTLSTGVKTSNYTWFFDAMKTNGLDYDIIGASYYPYWTNEKPTMLTDLANTMYSRYGKDLLVMEVGYSWTQYRPSGRYGGDYEGQLHLNGTPYNEATKAGQKAFIQELQTVVKGNDHILGYLYWDPVMVEQKVSGSWIETTWAMKKSGGSWWQDGNSVGNTTWFDYDGKALPIFEAMAEDSHIVPANVTIGDTDYQVEQQPPYVLTMSALGYSTFYDAEARLIPEGLTAYVARKVSANQLKLTSIDTDNIPAETGVVLKGNAGIYYLWGRQEATVISDNELTGTVIDIAKPAGTVLTLAKENDAVGFYNFTGSTIPAHKAYYLSPSGARSLEFTFDDVTSMTHLKLNTSGMDNTIYDLSGRKVSKPCCKGIYVVNHQKVVIK